MCRNPAAWRSAPSIWSLLRRQIRDRVHPPGWTPASTSRSPVRRPSGAAGISRPSSIRSVMRTAPAIHVRNSRINFKFGDTKSVFYLTETDLDISPPTRAAAAGMCTAPPSRRAPTARRKVSGSFTLKGRWFVAPERVDLDLQLDRTGLGELTALVRGQAGKVHGTITSRLHFGGPHQQHRHSGPAEYRRRPSLGPAAAARAGLAPRYPRPAGPDRPAARIAVQFRGQCGAAAFGALPRHATIFRSRTGRSALNWNRFPVAPLMELATPHGRAVPAELKLTGTMDGAIGYSGAGQFSGPMGFHDTARHHSRFAAGRFEQAYVVFDHGHARLRRLWSAPPIRTRRRSRPITRMDEQTLDLAISHRRHEGGSRCARRWPWPRCRGWSRSRRGSGAATCTITGSRRPRVGPAGWIRPTRRSPCRDLPTRCN